MRRQQSPERGLCLVTSFAMALDVPVTTLLADIGDRWKTLAFPGLPVPYCYRGVHVQELIQVALHKGFTVTPIELFPQVAPPQATHPHTFVPYPNVTVCYGPAEDANWVIFNEVILQHRGVVTGTLAPLGLQRLQRGHAMAFENGVLFDPDCEAYLYSQRVCEDHHFYPNCAYRFDQMEPLYAQSIQPDSEVSHANINN